MNGYHAYCFHQAIRLHFSGSYDAIKYHFKTKVRASSYEGRRDRYFFEKVAKWFPRQDDMVQFYVSNAVYSGSPNLWVGDLNQDHLETLRERVSNLTYRSARQVRQFPLPFDEMFRGDNPAIFKFEIELQVVMNVLLGFVSDMRKRLNDPLGIHKTHLDLIENYQPFLMSWVDISKVRAGILKALDFKK